MGSIQQPIQPKVPSVNSGDEPAVTETKPAQPQGMAAVLAQADELLAQGAQKLGRPAPQIANHGDRVRVAAEIHGALLAKDPKAATSFLQQLEAVGKPVALNFGLKHREANGSLGAVLNADAFKGLDAAHKQQHSALYAEFASSQTQTPEATKAATEDTQQPSTQPTATPSGTEQPPAVDFSALDVPGVMKKLGADDKNSGVLAPKDVQKVLDSGSLAPAEQQVLQALVDTGSKGWRQVDVAQGLQVLSELQPPEDADVSKLDVEQLMARLSQDDKTDFISLTEVRKALNDEQLPPLDRYVLGSLLTQAMFSTGETGWETQVIEQELGALKSPPADGQPQTAQTPADEQGQ